MRTAGFLLFLRVFYLGVFGTTISVSSEVSSSSVPMCECPCGSGLTVSTQSVSSSYGSGNLKSYSYSVSAPSVSSSYGSGNLKSCPYSVSAPSVSSLYGSGNLKSYPYSVSAPSVSSSYSLGNLKSYSYSVSAPSVSSSYGSGNLKSYSYSVSAPSVSSSYSSGNLKSYSYSVSAPSVSSSYGSGNLTSHTYSVSSTNKTQNYTTSSYYTSSSVTPVCYCPCGTSTSVVNAISVSGIQPTSSSVLNASTSAVVSSSINDIATEVPGRSQSLSTTPNVTPSTTKSLSNSSIEPVLASPSFSSHEPMRTSSSLPHERSSSSIETSRIAISGRSQSLSTTPNVTPSTTKSLSNSSIEHVLASPSFSSHESMRTSSSLPYERNSSSIETSRIATPSSVVDHTSLCECPCDMRSRFLAQASSSVSDLGSLSSLTSSAFGQRSSILAESSWSVYDSGSHSSFTNSVFGQISSALEENSRSLYDSEGLSSSASSAFAESHSVSGENSWSLYGSENPSSSTPMVFAQNASVPTETSSSVYDSENLSSSTSMGYVQDTPGSVIAPMALTVSENLVSSASTGLMQDISSVSGSLTSSSSSVGRKIISPTNTYRMSSRSASSVCYCPCSTSTPAPSPSSTVVSPTPTPSVVPPASNMYPYGPQQKDNEFGLDDSPYYYSDHCLRINTIRIGIPFFSERHYKLYICRNGIIQLDFEWSWWWPRKFGIYWWFDNMGIVAPFWATTDTYFAFKYNHSRVYYQVYSQTQNDSSEILDLATRHVKNYTEGFGDFEATWVLVVTWEKLCPYSYDSYYYRYGSEKNFQLNCPRSNTFQAVLITNGFNAFLMYNYPSKGIQWLVDADPDNYRYWTNFYGLPVAGWNAGDDGEHFENLKGSGTFGLTEIDKKAGNTGVVGRHFWRIENSDGEGAQEKCLRWDMQNRDWKVLDRYEELIQSDSEMACPCTGWQAFIDWGRFRWNWRNSWPELCFESRRSKRFEFTTPDGPLEFELIQQCCYSTQWEDWLSLKFGPPDGGRVKLTFPDDSNNRTKSFYTDEQAYKYCCVDSLNCDLFYKLRPSDSCSNYVPQVRRWFWGDPHIKTLDGGNYTFNGLGEYVMVDAQNGTFQLQARTTLAPGNSSTATIFSAGAAKEENSSTIEVRVKDGGGLVILIDSAHYYGYNNLTNQSVDVGGNLSVSKPKEDCLQVSFPSTSSVEFCENKEMMSFVVTLGKDFKNTTKGLLGTWNDNPKDDFTLPNGTVLSASSSLEDIHFDFGVKWQINQLQSLFTYADNESVANFSKLDFEPMFADKIAWQNDSLRRKAEEQCGDDYECLFDVASTNDLSIGSATKQISVQLVDDTNKLNNFPPKIGNTSDEINVTIHEIIELNITAVDNGAITFRVINKPVGATWNQTGNVLIFYWKVTSSQKFRLTFVATDEQNASAIWSPTIRMCACQHDGQCVEPQEGDVVNTDSKFVYLGCVCQGGYTGRFCDSDINACEWNGEPCYAGVKCIDLPPPANSSGYECGPCPSGYTGNGAQCVDIDECKKNSPKQCEHKCVNTPGSFFCDCNDGFKLKDDRRNCEDIDECFPTSDCMQNCNNAVGSYNCSCNEYFKTDPIDWRKCVAKNQCTSDSDPGCDHVCYEDSNKRAACTCRANFELQSDGKTCKDIDECAKDLDRCSQTCTNTGGSYKCSCQTGFELKKDGYGCEDINECLDDDTYECPDKNQRCVNTRGSYRCECVQDTYYIDGKCQGLNKTQPPPKLLLPEPRNASESEKEEAVQFSIPSGIEWDYDRDKSFKTVVATVASDFCNKNRTICGLKDSRRKRRSSYNVLYDYEKVHLLPGYPKNSSDSLQVAFYVLQPAFLFIGNSTVLPRDALVAIMKAHKFDIEKAIGANISDIEALFKPTTTTESPTAGPAEPADDSWKWIVIGVVIGVVVIILIGLLIFCVRKRKRDVKPITDPSEEQGYRPPGEAKKENTLGSGSHSA